MARDPNEIGNSSTTPSAGSATNKHLFDILMFVLVPNGTQADLADKLDMDTGDLSKAKTKGIWSGPGLASALAALNDGIHLRNGSTTLSNADLSGPTEALIEKLALRAEVKNSLYWKLGLEIPHQRSREAAVLRELTDIWAVFYVCRDAEELDLPALAVATFDIFPDSSGREAIVHETSHAPNEPMPKGTLKIRHNTIEIDLDYIEPQYPVAKYLTVLPKPAEINGLLLTALDIKTVDRDVVSRPILMIKVKKDAQHPRQFSRETDLFRVVSSFLSQFAPYNTTFLELAHLREPKPHELHEVRKMVLQEWDKVGARRSK